VLPGDPDATIPPAAPVFFPAAAVPPVPLLLPELVAVPVSLSAFADCRLILNFQGNHHLIIFDGYFETLELSFETKARKILPQEYDVHSRIRF
jgi:hypothetical protein